MALSLGELAGRLGAELHGDPGISVERVATLQAADPSCVSFLSNRRYRKQLADTRAAAVILAEQDLSGCPVAALVLDNPYLGFARVAAILNPPPPRPSGIHPAATVSADAQVDKRAWIGPQADVAAGAIIGAEASVGPGCAVGENAILGEQSMLVANVTLCRGVRIGRRCLLHPGVVVGADGFGIANDNGVWVKVPQMGSVRIGDDVEIGANTTVDRGALDDTVVENGVKLDNLVQVGHNVHVGSHTAIAGCVAIGGSARIGSRCTIAGAASIAGHLEIADDVHLTATSSVASSVPDAGVYSSGMTIQDNRSWRRNVVRMHQLDDMARRIRALEQFKR